MTTNDAEMPRSALERVRSALEQQIRGNMSYGAMEKHWGVSRGTLWRIVNIEGYEPVKDEIRIKLGLPMRVVESQYRNRKTGRYTEG